MQFRLVRNSGWRGLEATVEEHRRSESGVTYSEQDLKTRSYQHNTTYFRQIRRRLQAF